MLFQITETPDISSVVIEWSVHIFLVTKVWVKLKILPSTIVLYSAFIVEYSLLYNCSFQFKCSDLNHSKQ